MESDRSAHGLNIAPTTGVVSGTPPTTVLGGSVTITVTDNFGCTGQASTTINVRPVAGNDSFSGAVGNTQLAVGSIGSLPLTPTATLSGNVKSNDNGVGAPGALSVSLAGTSTNGGTIAEGTTDGSFLYAPPAGSGALSDSFSYTLTDGNGVTNTATATINFQNRVWYVNSAGGNGDGRSNNPFNSLVNAAAPSASGDIIYVRLAELVAATHSPGSDCASRVRPLASSRSWASYRVRQPTPRWKHS